MEKIIRGIQEFQQQIFRPQRQWFEQMAMRQQQPLALFITCSDSRVNPNLLTQTEPGELFLLRNAGNIVPTYGQASGGEEATIEYAVSVLGIKNIILCGHSQCGAMQALNNLKNVDDLPSVRSWFAHAEATRRIVQSKYQDLPPDELLVRTIQENVLVQVSHLKTHPAVAAGLSRGELHVYGWVYVIETGEVLAYDADSQRFTPIHRSIPEPLPEVARLHIA